MVSLIAEDKLRDALLDKLKLEQKVSQLELDLINARELKSTMTPSESASNVELEKELRQKDLDLKMLKQELQGFNDMQNDIRSYKSKIGDLRPRIQKVTEEFAKEVDDIQRELQGKFGEEEEALRRLQQENALKQEKLDYLRELLANERRNHEQLQRTHATEHAELDHQRRLNEEVQRNIDEMVAEKNDLIRNREINEGKRMSLMSEMKDLNTGGAHISEFDVELLRGQKMELENEISFLRQTIENEQRRLNGLESAQQSYIMER